MRALRICAALLFTIAAVIALLSLSILASADARAEGATGISFLGFLLDLGLVLVGWRLVAWRPTARVEPFTQPADKQPSDLVCSECGANTTPSDRFCPHCSAAFDKELAADL